MKLIKAFTLSVFLISACCMKAGLNETFCVIVDMPAKTIFIKNSAAQNVDQFFAGSTSLSFEVYKIGDASELKKTVDAIKKNKDVQSCEAGKATGDYQNIVVTLKSAKDKAFWAALFKSAGLNNIKINNNEIVAVEKM